MGEFWIYAVSAGAAGAAVAAYVVGRHKANASLRDSLAALHQLREITGKIPGVVYQCLQRTDGSAHLPFASEGVQGLYGLSPREATGDPKRLFESVDPDDLRLAREALDSALLLVAPWVAEYRVRQGDGSVRWHANAAVPQIQQDGSVLWHGFVTDVTDRKSNEAEIQKLAFYDPLTGLPNRRLLMDRLQKVLAASKRSREHVAVFLMDMDKFKAINDNFGHDAGDIYLRTAAERMNTCLRASDTAARFAGDEFVVLLSALSADPDEALVQTQTVAEKLLRQFQLPYQLGNHNHHGSASIGVCLSGDPNDLPLELLKRADIAAYAVKDGGGNGLRFFAPDMQAAVDARVKMATDFRLAMRDQQFVLFYQEQVDAQGQLVGAEVLLRWKHPELGLVTPDAFVPHAEDTGLILPLGQWVLDASCAQLAAWSKRPETRHMTVSVNVSAKQFQHAGYVESVLETLKRTGAPTDRLVLELTESVMVTALDEVVAKMLKLREHGIALALDDFGTGYSSLAYLRQLPLNQLKIDKSFVQDIVKSSNISISRSIIALGQGMGLQVVAEGVETTAQLEILIQLGCDIYQGYYFGRPKTPEDFEKLFEPDLLLPPSSIE
jgi:diguanylate cyclase (GGDEF)-like protein/PAS domain S-box-containing protein